MKPADNEETRGGRKSAAFLPGLTDALARSLSPGALAVWYTRMSRWLTGVDRRVLARCSKAQQTLYSAIAVIMLIAALLTAAGAGTKLAVLWGAGMALTAGLFCAVFVLALAMEAAVLASISPNANPFTTLAVRVPIGVLLVAMQVLPVLTNVLAPRIELALHEQNLNHQAALNAKSERLLNLSAIKAEAMAREQGVTKALSELAHPPADVAVQGAQEALEKAIAAVRRAQSQVQAAKARVTSLGKARDSATNAASSERLTNALNAARAQLAKAHGTVNLADADLQSKEAELKAAKDTQAAALAQAVVDAKGAARAQADKLTDAEGQFSEHRKTAAKLGAAAAGMNFGIQVVALLRLAVSDFAVGLTCLGTLMAFVLLDLLPTAIKLGTRNGLYQRLVSIQDEQVHATALHQAALGREDDRQEIAAKENQTRGMRKFTEQDYGELEAQLLLLDGQRCLDIATATASPQVILATLEGLTPVIDLLVRQKTAMAEHPDIAPAYHQQLTALLYELQARADGQARQVTQAGGGAPLGAATA